MAQYNVAIWVVVDAENAEEAWDAVNTASLSLPDTLTVDEVSEPVIAG